MSKKEQFLIRIETDLIASLQKAAEQYGRRSGNEVATEIITLYLPFWEEIEIGKQKTLEKQRASLTGTERGA
ncbi:MAG: hypothetical protein HYR56_25955 [Acidobacteria bacterium]|nr:hypothetical protein [Acidobacteriota bacterium]MBI3427673.1 hypothetical protein [Acidobacteriota bacterium]